MTVRGGGRARRVLLGAALASVVAAAGCGGVPSSGGVNLGREVAPGRELDNFDVRVLPPPPIGGEAPRDIVHGFLVASVSDEDDSKVARLYLTPRAAARWNPHASVTLYDEPSLAMEPRGDAAIVITAARLGVVGDDGDYRPSPGSLSTAFHLQQVSGEWRVNDPPSGRLFMTLDGAPSFRPQDVFFLDPSQQVVVPDRVLFRVPRNGLPTALMRALVAGPTEWLRPAVLTAFPTGTRLLGNVPVNNGVADVNLSREVLNAGPLARAALSAQIVWTLRQVSNISAVRIFADGAPLTVPGAAQRQPMDAWEQYDPDGSDDLRLHYVDKGEVQIESIGPALAHRPKTPLTRPAVSVDGRLVAGVVSSATKQTVYSGAVTSTLAPRVSGTVVTTPSFDRSDVVWTVVTDRYGTQRVLRLLPSGEVVPVAAEALLDLGDVRELRISREGTRVAAVVYDGTQSRLVVGRVAVGRNGGWSVDGFRNPLPGWTDVGAIAWNDADHLVALAREPSGRSARRVPVQTDVTGYLVTTLPVGGLPAEVTELAAAPGRPVVASGNGRMWMSTLGMWRTMGRGSDPTYPG